MPTSSMATEEKEAGERERGWIFVNGQQLRLPKSQWDGCLLWVMGSGEGRKEAEEEGRKKE